MYYIRQQTRISGPFPAEQVRTMLRRGRVTRSDKVSTDRQTWLAISDCGELIEQAPAVEETPADPTPATDGYAWFYTRNGVQQQESIDTPTLSSLIVAGAVSRTDMVWREGFAAWAVVATIPELAAAIASPGFPPPDTGLDLGLPPIAEDGRFPF